MSEQRFEMKPYGVKYMCDECSVEMVASDRILMSFPAQVPHTCPKCEKIVNLKERYPLVRWEYA